MSKCRKVCTYSFIILHKTIHRTVFAFSNTIIQKPSKTTQRQEQPLACLKIKGDVANNYEVAESLLFYVNLITCLRILL